MGTRDQKLAVFGIFASRVDLEQCVAQLRATGFGADDVSALLPNEDSSHPLGLEKRSKAPEGASAGAGAGAVLGGAIGWLAGIGTLVGPAFAPIIAGGPLLAGLAGAAVGAAVGGVSGTLIGLGIPEYEAKRYAGLLEEGRYLLSVHCKDREATHQARDIIQDCGASDIASTAEAAVPTRVRTSYGMPLGFGMPPHELPPPGDVLPEPAPARWPPLVPPPL